MDKIALTIAVIALTLHGLMELAPLLFMFRSRLAAQNTGKGIPRFIFEPLQNNIRTTMFLGLIFGFIRVIAAAGIAGNFMWAWGLGVSISIVTLMIMTFYLPMGIVDGILSGITLLSLLITYWGNRPIL
ncbi:MAG TPA: hypothetical protein VK249_21650 [Anaerolineales bacterium]|nr:hypothetical protein [Anaerolineales bacterium]